MSDLIEVAFKGNRKEFFRWEDVVPPPAPPTHVIVEGDRGEDFGMVHAIGALAEKRFAGVAHGSAIGDVTRRVIRTATRDEVKRAQALTEDNESTRRSAMSQVRALNLQMKITDAEWQWDHRKLTLFFTAEKRVDFRTLVRDLAAQFKARIELKQIGVRDEAKRLDGIGRCGRQYCSASWLPDLRPVNLGVAKEQKLSLNPTQISGACGRLMCCLRYEHEFYASSRKRFPKEGKILVTSKGEEKVMVNNIFYDKVTLRAVDGETRILTLTELRQETSSWTPGSNDDSTPMDAHDHAVEGVLLDEDLPPQVERTRMPPQNERALPVLREQPTQVLRVSAPSVSTPSVSTPSVSTPTVSTPSASASVVSTPSAIVYRDAPVEPAALVELSSTLPIVAASAPVAQPVVTSAPMPVADAPDADDDDDDSESDDNEVDSAASTDADTLDPDAPKRRRRRGRRGGRRGRGNRPPSSGDSTTE
jgi:cell fate regulator YaaT (PSP1 superfamily)